MSASCSMITIRAQFLKETGRDFHEWQSMLLSMKHENQVSAIGFLMMHGLSKSKAEFLVSVNASRIIFADEKR